MKDVEAVTLHGPPVCCVRMQGRTPRSLVHWSPGAGPMGQEEQEELGGMHQTTTDHGSADTHWTKLTHLLML